ncbi:hypothetical protein B0H19DRAFT_1071065 [Mycena capillaripes]|nr:hypothetical protein B0H19DRAFT_1071065 [Mycena capillaripes]
MEDNDPKYIRSIRIDCMTVSTKHQERRITDRIIQNANRLDVVQQRPMEDENVLSNAARRETLSAGAVPLCNYIAVGDLNESTCGTQEHGRWYSCGRLHCGAVSPGLKAAQGMQTRARALFLPLLSRRVERRLERTTTMFAHKEAGGTWVACVKFSIKTEPTKRVAQKRRNAESMEVTVVNHDLPIQIPGTQQKNTSVQAAARPLLPNLLESESRDCGCSHATGTARYQNSGCSHAELAALAQRLLPTTSPSNKLGPWVPLSEDSPAAQLKPRFGPNGHVTIASGRVFDFAVAQVKGDVKSKL